MTLEQKIEQMIQYLQLKVVEKDWHGVSDAANDIRVLEAKLEVTRLSPTYTKTVRTYDYRGHTNIDSSQADTKVVDQSLARYIIGQQGVALPGNATEQMANQYPYQQPGFKVLAGE